MRGEYEFEPIPGLPEVPPAGERILWQGSPSWKKMAMRPLHIRATAIYFILLLAWYIESKFSAGEPMLTIMLSTLRLAGLAVAALALMASFALMAAKSTVYTITSKRVVIRAGVALPVVLNLPFSKILSADFKSYTDGSGDIALTLPPKDRVAYLMLWPHAQPWHMARARPMLRGIPNADAAARILSQALAEASGATQTVSRKERAPAQSRPHAPALA
jgi:hypothetical protein